MGNRGEFLVSFILLAIAEVLGDNQGYLFGNGGSFSIIPNRVQVDAALDHQFSLLSGGRWISFGLRLTLGRLF
ncbi:hypothetical protein SAMN05421863_104720 [Nitrosomonas communis]|uniref:Uncharacterized protein n=1 Tax=Nitrosomonas communis TaxID=44574 RepID=A0A1I4T5M5_9PROT|nr:hypothetical protein SAMN05421863_104720 [Nitrosomonas communis]